MTNTNQTQTVIKFDDTFYLKNKQGQYLVAADRGRYFFPQLDHSGQTKLQIIGDTGELQHNDQIRIRSLETRLGDRDVLGAFSDSHNCYYWKDGYDKDKQSWKITKVRGEGKLCYGDEVYLTNVYYDNQTLVADPKHPGYLTTVKNAREVWILETTETSTITESSTSKLVNVFDLSVASGDPTPTGVMLWTRINPEAYQEVLPLKYEVSRRREFKKSDIVISDLVSNSKFGDKTDYTVKIDLDRKLESNQTYFYRFIYGEAISPIGRCRTLPAKNKEMLKLRLAVITCNDYSSGYFNAFYHLAEEDVDFVIHLGDFVYEYPQYPQGYGEIVRKDLKLTDNKFPTTHPDKNVDRTTSLTDFYHAYRTYRRDPALQKAMENHTWIITLDDHEIADNCYWDYANQTMSVSVEEPLHPIQENLGEDSDRAKKAMKQLYKNATFAWSQYIPVRLEPEITESTEPPYKLYRHFRFGSLIDFYLTDSRSFRDKPDLELNQAILAKTKEYRASNPKLKISEVMKTVRQEMGLNDWQASMLGKDQREWLIKGITGSDAKWKVWGNQTLLATSTMNEMIGEIDDWHGFKAERYEILQAIKDHETEKYGNETSRFVVFTGDMHTSLIAYLKTETDSLASDLATSDALGNFVSALKNTGKGIWSGATLDLSSAVGNLEEGAKNLATGAVNVLEDVGSSIMNPLEAGKKIAEDGVNNANSDYKKLAGVEFMTPAVTSPGLSEYIYVGAEGIVDSIEETVGINLAPVTETVGAAASSALGGASSFLGSLIPDVSDKVSTHKLTTANFIKSLSPHIEHFDSSINGYAIAEFTEDMMTWKVYAIDKTIYDKADDGRNLSTSRASKRLAQSATYKPNGICLDD